MEPVWEDIKAGVPIHTSGFICKVVYTVFFTYNRSSMESYLEKIPEHLRRFADPALPKEMRLMAARGIIPIPSKDLAVVLYSFVLDQDEEIKKEAETSLTSIPENVIAGVLSDVNTPLEFLDYVARSTNVESKLQKIVLNRSTSDGTIAYLAGVVHFQSVLEIIASNQERLLRDASIVEALSNNPAVSRSTLDRVISFIKLYLNRKGEIPESLAEDTFAQDGSQEVEDPALEGDIKEDSVQVVGETTQDVQESFLDDINFSSDLTEETGEDIGEEKRESLFSMIRRMGVGEKIKLAVIGNGEARMILVQDPRRVVACAVLQNPRLNDMDAIRISQSKTVMEDVLRGIAASRKWTRVYQVKVALVNNAKTPPSLSLHLIPHLRDRELKLLANNKNIPGVVSSTARRMIKQKQEGVKEG